MNKEQIVAIIQRGYFTDGDLADALLAELAKQSEPVAWVGEGLKLQFPEELDHMRKYEPGLATLYDTPLFAHPLPQPDLVAENEQLRQQLSAAQEDNEQFYAALEKIDEDAKDTCLASVRHLGRIANGAIAAYKARKEKV